MGAVVADTHAALWYLTDSPRLSQRAAEALDGALASGDPIHVSAISLIEAIYLVEKGKLERWALRTLEDALVKPDKGLRAVPVGLAVALEVPRIPRDAVPDMPDRIIAATARHLSLPLVTHDARIRGTDIETIW